MYGCVNNSCTSGASLIGSVLYPSTLECAPVGLFELK